MNFLITALPQEGLEDIIRTVPLDYAIFYNIEQFSNCSEQGVKPLMADTRKIGRSWGWAKHAHDLGCRWKCHK